MRRSHRSTHRLATTLGVVLALPLIVTSGACASSKVAKRPAGAERAGPSSTALLPNAHQVDDRILVGGQPSAAQIEALKAAGYTTLISLQTEGEPGVKEELEQARALGLKVVHLPVGSIAAIDAEKARALGAALAEGEGKVALHCRSGNRAAALLALSRFEGGGLTPEAALDLATRAGLTKPVLKAHLQQVMEAEASRRSGATESGAAAEGAAPAEAGETGAPEAAGE